jgi:hypothetical protein
MREKQDALASLRIEKKELEDNLKAPNKKELKDTFNPPNKLSIAEAIQKTKAEIEKNKNRLETEKEEHPKIIWKKDEQTPESTKSAEDENKEEQEKKKKLRFF